MVPGPASLGMLRHCGENTLVSGTITSTNFHTAGQEFDPILFENCSPD